MRVALDDRDYDALKHRAIDEHLTIAQAIGRAVSLYLAREQKEESET